MSKTIEERFIDYFSPSLPLFQAKPTSYQFLCPYCQFTGTDGKGNKIPAYKAKGYLYLIGNTWNYKCHKCGEHQSFTKFLEVQFPLLHFKYVRLREQLGTTGFQTNCPSLETLLKKRGMLGGQPPEFRPERFHQRLQRPASPPAAPSAPAAPKVTKLPSMRSPQHQAGHQSRINHLVKQREQKRRHRSGELW